MSQLQGHRTRQPEASFPGSSRPSVVTLSNVSASVGTIIKLYPGTPSDPWPPVARLACRPPVYLALTDERPWSRLQMWVTAPPPVLHPNTHPGGDTGMSERSSTRTRCQGQNRNCWPGPGHSPSSTTQCTQRGAGTRPGSPSKVSPARNPQGTPQKAGMLTS